MSTNENKEENLLHLKKNQLSESLDGKEEIRFTKSDRPKLSNNIFSTKRIEENTKLAEIENNYNKIHDILQVKCIFFILLIVCYKLIELGSKGSRSIKTKRR